MRRYAFSTAFALTAAAVCFAPLRADNAVFTRQLEAAVHELIQESHQHAAAHSHAVMAQDLHQLIAGVGAQLLNENTRLMSQKTPLERRIPLLRQLYLQQMRRIHDLEPDDASVVKYNERTQSFRYLHLDVHGGGFMFTPGGVDSFSSKLNGLLELQTSLAGDPFAAELTAALQGMQSDWRRFIRSHPHLEHMHLSFPHMLPTGAPHVAIVTGSAGTASLTDFPDGVGTIVMDIDYELTKLDVELAEQNLTPEKRVEKLRDRFFEILEKANKTTGPMVQFDAEAVQLLIMDMSGAHLTFQFPPALSTFLNTQAVEEERKRRVQLFMAGGAALALLLLGGLYLAMKITAGKEDVNE